MPLHPIIGDAAAGRLPHWSQPSEHRLGHMRRVASLLGSWADALALSQEDRMRWCAAGLLHDALREEKPDQLRHLVPEPMRDLAGKLLHGPAAAARLRDEGVDDEPLLLAITSHTLGHPELDALGRALFIADYIEPGRRYDPANLAVLRARMPHARAAVLAEVARARIERLLRDNTPIREETAAFWNVVARAAHG